MMVVIGALLLLAQAPHAQELSDQAIQMAQQKRFADAEKLWKQALSIAPNLFSAAFNLGYLYQSQGQFAAAESYLSRAVRIQPDDFNARYLLGATYERLGRGDDALRQWRAALALRPEHGKLLQIMAVEYMKGRYFRDAAAVGERALALNAKDPAVYLLAIKARQDAGEHAQALKLAEAFVRQFPHLPRANFEYGFELYRAGRPAEGLPYVKKAMEADDAYEEPFFFYGDMLLKEGRTDEAITALEKAVALKPDYLAARMALARALLSTERYDAAREQLLRAAASDPRHPQPHLLLSQLYFRQGDEKRAAEEKALSLRLRRENPQATEGLQGRPFPD